MTTTPRKFGLSMHDAARAMGIKFREDAQPEDKSLTMNGLRFHYLDWGKEGNPPLVLLHGGGQTCHMWDFFSLVFRDQYHIYALDQRNHGDTDVSEDNSLDSQMADVGGFLDHLGVGRTRLIGFSMGGRNSFCYTALNPDRVEALVIVDVGPEMKSRQGGDGIRDPNKIQTFKSLDDIAERIRKHTPNRSIEQIKGSLVHTVYQRDDGTWGWKNQRGGMPIGGSWDSELMWEYVGKIKCPTLVVRATQSEVFPGETADKMIDMMPNAMQMAIGNSGHRVAGDNPLHFERAVRGFFDTLPD
ncbi:MAG: alpha/beta hydrolase [Dehalococcoidia bacterium]